MKSIVVQWLLSTDDSLLFFSAISLGEVRKGTTALPRGARKWQLERWIEVTLRPWFLGRILPVDASIAEHWGRISAEQSHRGRPIGMADGLIAATALEHDLTLVTRNVKDFVGLGVVIFNPWTA